jgi:hypothetical protein
MSQKKYTDKKGGKTGAKGRTFTPKPQEAATPLFFWSAAPNDTSPWVGRWPKDQNFKNFIDPFSGDGASWILASKSFDSLSINDYDNERSWVFKLTTRREVTVVHGITEFLRLCGIFETWHKSHVDAWHAFHVEHFVHRVTDTQTLLSKLSVLFKVTLTPLLEAQSQEFSYQHQSFKQSMYAALIHGMKKCLASSIKLGDPLPIETFQNEFRWIVFHGLFIYTKGLYESSRSIGQFSDPYHALTYIVYHSLSQQPLGANVVFSPFQDLVSFEKKFKIFDDPLAQSGWRKTHFSSADPIDFMHNSKISTDTFVFSKIPKEVTSIQFGDIYDVAWGRDAKFLWIVSDEQLSSINHLGTATKMYNNQIAIDNF